MTSLAGTYRLVDWVFTLDGVMPRRPFGPDVEGLLTYTEDGRMWATLMKERAPFGTPSFAAAPLEIRAQAAAGYLNYAGTYDVEDGVVVHHVEVSLFPDWVGEDQRRLYRFEGELLVLETPDSITSDGKRAKNTLRWKRVDGVKNEESR